MILISLMICAAIAGAIVGREFMRRSSEREIRASRLEAQLAQSHFRALQAQLQPDFLFNALNSVVMLMRADATRDAVKLVLGFSDLMRYVLDGSTPRLAPLGNELAFIQKYLEIEHVRFGSRLQFTIDAPEEARAVPIPGLLLQPLVDNAIRHGVASRPEGGTIRIAVSVVGRQLRIEVSDDGAGVGPNWRWQSSRGTGLTSTVSRLERMYGADGFAFEARPREPRGLSVSVRVPGRCAS